MKILVFVLMSVATQCLAQGYIVTGDSLKQGKVHRNGKRSLTFYDAGDRNGIDYSLDQISEYREKWNVYEALVIDGRRAFHRRLTDGGTKLYRVGSHYALKSNESIVEIRRKNFRDELNKKLNFNATGEDLSRLTYSRRSLTTIVNRSDYASFDIRDLPYGKFGIVLGYNLLHLKISPYQMSLSKQVAAPSAGIFLDVPLTFRKSKMYLTGEVNGSKYQASFFKKDNGIHTYFTALNMKNVNAIASLKLVASRGSFRPYGKAGLMASRIWADCPTGFIATTKDGGDIYVNNLPLDASSTGTQFGFNIAGGMQIPIAGRKNIHLELRYTRSFNKVFGQLDLNLSNLGISAGINL